MFSEALANLRYLVSNLIRVWGLEEPFPGAFLIGPLLHLTLWSIIAYRLGRFLWLLPSPLRQIFAPIRHFQKRLVQMVTSTHISENADIGPGFYIAHNGTLVIGGGVKAGKNYFVRQGVTIGGNAMNPGHSTIGDHVVKGAWHFMSDKMGFQTRPGLDSGKVSLIWRRPL
jgi:serine acetyltransferase